MVSGISCGLVSGLEIDWAAGAARRGSLRCLSTASAGVDAGFFSTVSVAVARAVSELILTARGEVGVEALDAGAAAASACAGVVTVCAGAAADAAAAGGAGAWGRGGAIGVAATAGGAGMATGAGAGGTAACATTGVLAATAGTV